MNKIDLKECINENAINEIIDFNYADIIGYAETIGYQIIVFTEKKNDIQSAISIEDIDDKQLEDIANCLLGLIDKDLFIGQKKSIIERKYGKYKYKDDLFIDSIKYYYLNNSILYVFGFCKDKMNYAEIVYNHKIIKNRLSIFDE